MHSIVKPEPINLINSTLTLLVVSTSAMIVAVKGGEDRTMLEIKPESLVFVMISCSPVSLGITRVAIRVEGGACIYYACPDRPIT